MNEKTQNVQKKLHRKNWKFLLTRKKSKYIRYILMFYKCFTSKILSHKFDAFCHLITGQKYVSLTELSTPLNSFAFTQSILPWYPCMYNSIFIFLSKIDWIIFFRSPATTIFTLIYSLDNLNNKPSVESIVTMPLLTSCGINSFNKLVRVPFFILYFFAEKEIFVSKMANPFPDNAFVHFSREKEKKKQTQWMHKVTIVIMHLFKLK